MNLFLLKKLVYILLQVGFVAVFFVFTMPFEWQETHKRGVNSWLYVLIVTTFVITIFNIVASFLKPMRKPRNLKITDSYVTVSGIKIARRDIRDWRIFRTTHYGERRRCIEIELKRVPVSPIEWDLLKTCEPVPPSNRCDRGIPLGREPRIVAILGTLDLTKDEIERAMGAVSNEP